MGHAAQVMFSIANVCDANPPFSSETPQEFAIDSQTAHPTTSEHMRKRQFMIVVLSIKQWCPPIDGECRKYQNGRNPKRYFGHTSGHRCRTIGAVFAGGRAFFIDLPKTRPDEGERDRREITFVGVKRA